MSQHPLFIPAPYQDAVDHGRIILRDGTAALIRLATLQDAPALQAFFARLSEESRRHRFLSLAQPPLQLVQSFCDSSRPEQLLTLLVTRRIGDHEAIVGAGSYIARNSKSAEVAFA